MLIILFIMLMFLFADDMAGTNELMFVKRHAYQYLSSILPDLHVLTFYRKYYWHGKLSNFWGGSSTRAIVFRFLKCYFWKFFKILLSFKGQSNSLFIIT